MKKVLILLLCVSSYAFAQTSTMVDPATRIAWPHITGSGTPASLGFPCTDANYGQPFLNIAMTPNINYTCGTSGWQVDSSGQPVTLTGPVTGSGTGTVATTITASGVTAGNYNFGGQVVTINAAGQITAAGNPFAASISSCSACGTREIGAASSSPATFSFIYANGTVQSATISDGTTTNSLTSPFTSGSIASSYCTNAQGQASFTFTLNATAMNAQTASATNGVSCLPRTFGGVGTAGATGATASGASAVLAGATGTLASAGLGNQGSYGPFSPSSQNIYILMQGGSHTFTSGGFAFPMNTPTAVGFVNVNGATVPLYLYQSTNSFASGTFTLILASGMFFPFFARRRKILMSIPLLLAGAAGAQVPLGGHVYTTASTDSSLGGGTVVFTADANCTIATQTNCTVTATTGDTASGPYVKTLVVTGGVTLTATRNIIVPTGGNREYNIKNSSNGGQQVNVIGATGTGTMVPNCSVSASTCLVSTVFDGTNVVANGGGGVGGSTTINGTTCASGGTCALSSMGKTVYLSSLAGATPVASVAPGTNATGFVDSITAINAALANSNVSRLIVDAPFGISNTISVPSNKTIECTAGNGFIMLPNSNAIMIENSTQITSPSSCAANTPAGSPYIGYLISNQCQSNIVVRGCEMNMNSVQSITNTDRKTNTAGTSWLVAMQMLGVDKLELHDVSFDDAGIFSFGASNVTHVVLDHVNCTAKITSSSSYGANTDCYHINGPADTLDIHDGVLGPNGDDCMGFNADDWYSPGSTSSGGPYSHFAGWSQGPITNLRVHHMHLNNCFTGIRLLSAGDYMDNISIDDIDGSTAQQVFLVSHYTNNYPCQVGSVMLSNMNVARGTNVSFGTPYYYFADCQSLGNLTFSHDRMPPSASGLSFFGESPSTNLKQLSMIGNVYSNLTGTQNGDSAGNPNALLKLFGYTGQVSDTGTNWQDAPSNTAHLWGGFYGPQKFTVDGIAGDIKRLVSFTSVSGVFRGNPFTQQNTYISTVFNEATGALNGTSPASGGTVWVDGANAWTYASGGGVTSSTAASPAYVNPNTYTGYAIHVIRNNPSLFDGGQVIFKIASSTVYFYVDFAASGVLSIGQNNAGALTVYGGVQCTSAITNGLATVSVNGSTVTASAGSCTVSVVIAAGTDESNSVGINNRTGNAITFTSFVVDNQFVNNPVNITPPVTLVQSNFTEEPAGTVLAGTVPSVGPAGATWVTAGSWTYAVGSNYPTQANAVATSANYALINVGQAGNYTISGTFFNPAGANTFQVFWNWADSSDYFVANFGTSSTFVFGKVVGGAYTQLGTNTSCYNADSGYFAVASYGTATKVTINGCSASATFPSPASGGLSVGFNNLNGTSGIAVANFKVTQ